MDLPDGPPLLYLAKPSMPNVDPIEWDGRPLGKTVAVAIGTDHLTDMVSPERPKVVAATTSVLVVVRPSNSASFCTSTPRRRSSVSMPHKFIGSCTPNSNFSGMVLDRRPCGIFRDAIACVTSNCSISDGSWLPHSSRSCANWPNWSKNTALAANQRRISKA